MGQATTAPVAKSIDRLKTLLSDKEPSKNSRMEQYRASIGKIVKIPIEDIYLDENVRRQIDTEGSNFKSLLSSIKKHGIQQNIVVEFRQIGSDYKIVCVSGHRRVVAAKLCSSTPTISALIKEFDDANTRTELGLIENLLREDLHCLDIADGYKQLHDNGWSREKLSKTFAKVDRTIHTYLKMSLWPESARKIITNNPNALTAKVLTRKIACRRFEDDKSLIDALNKQCSFSVAEGKTKSRKEVMSEKLSSYLAEKKYNKDVTNKIKAAFKTLGLI